MTVDEFLLWADGRDGRWELHDGVPVQLGVPLEAAAHDGPVAMAPQRAAHIETKLSATLALNEALRKSKAPCRLLMDGIAVRLDSQSTYQPDIVVYCGSRLGPNDREVKPVLVVEVLSPSTEGIDKGIKVRRYFELPSIKHYLILDPDDRSIILHSRGESEGLLQTRIARAGPLRFDPPGFEVQIEDLFPEPYEAETDGL